MTKIASFLLLFISVTSWAQLDSLNVQFVKKEAATFDNLIGYDNFNNQYSLTNNTLTKSSGTTRYVYNNIQLGTIEHVDITNPLKIVVFYKQFNTVVVLDNTLTEIKIINFNRAREFKKVTHASVAYENHLWIYNELNQELELYNYLTNRTILKTLPILSTLVSIKSTFNYCWVVTDSSLRCYNVYGSEISTIPIESVEAIKLYSDLLIMKKKQSLYCLYSKNEITKISLPELNIQDFSLNNETLYLYDGNFIYYYKLIK